MGIAIVALFCLALWMVSVPLLTAAVRSLRSGRPLRISAWRAGAFATQGDFGTIGTVVIGLGALAAALFPVALIVHAIGLI